MLAKLFHVTVGQENIAENILTFRTCAATG